MDKKVIPAHAEFNREVGNSGKDTALLKKQMISAGVEMEQLGYSFEEGASFVRDFAKAANTTDLSREILKTGKELTFVLGLTAEQAGKLTLQFQKQGASSKEVNEMFKVGAREAKAYGLPINEALRELGDAPDILARFGISNRKEFAVSAVKARSYGLSIKEVTNAFGKQLDTFEGSSTAAAKLNAVFGTSINSLKLMLETDPTKRMEMLRGELTKQGKSWEKLNVFEKNVIAQTLGVDEASAALILSSEKERKKLEQKNKEKQKQIKIDEDWNKGLGSIKKTLIAWEPLLDNLMRSASDFIVRLFGGDSAADKVTDTAKAAENAIKSITQAINEGANKIEHYRDLWDDWFKSERGVDVEEANKLVKLIQKQNKSIEEQAQIYDIMNASNSKEISEIAQRKLRLEGKNTDQLQKLQNTFKPKEMIFDDKEISTAIPQKQKELTINTNKSKTKDKKTEAKKQQENNKQIAQIVGDVVRKNNNNGQQTMILVDVNGAYIAKAIMKNSVGG